MQQMHKTYGVSDFSWRQLCKQTRRRNFRLNVWMREIVYLRFHRQPRKTGVCIWDCTVSRHAVQRRGVGQGGRRPWWTTPTAGRPSKTSAARAARLPGRAPPRPPWARRRSRRRAAAAGSGASSTGTSWARRCVSGLKCTASTLGPRTVPGWPTDGSQVRKPVQQVRKGLRVRRVAAAQLQLESLGQFFLMLLDQFGVVQTQPIWAEPLLENSNQRTQRNE